MLPLNAQAGRAMKSRTKIFITGARDAQMNMRPGAQELSDVYLHAHLHLTGKIG